MKTPEEILEAKLLGGEMLPYTKRIMIEAMEEYAREMNAHAVEASKREFNYRNHLQEKIAEMEQNIESYKLTIDMDRDHIKALEAYIAELQEVLTLRNNETV